MVRLIKQKPLRGSKKRRKVQKRVVKRIKRAFPLATSALGVDPGLTSI